jgi:hypothetical protein
MGLGFLLVSGFVLVVVLVVVVVVGVRDVDEGAGGYIVVGWVEGIQVVGDVVVCVGAVVVLRIGFGFGRRLLCRLAVR